jgi:polyphosphate glucokinase
MGKRTLCIDIGGTGIKGSVYDADGAVVHDRVRIATPRPALPETVLATAVDVAKQSGDFDRISCGFPGVVEDGVIHTAPNLDGEWNDFPLASELERRTGRAARVLNDAAIQGLAVIEGKGVELVLTLGTGLGSGLYVDGHCIPLELGHHPSGLGKDPRKSYEDLVDDAQRKSLGKKKWRARVLAVIQQLKPIINFRRLYLGGGNAARLDPSAMPPWVTIVDNKAGMLGGLKLWRDE